MIRGYVTSRSFAGLTVPVPAQNACLREYARSLDIQYCLPPLEHKFENCYMQLFTLLESSKVGDTIAMYSISIMPLNSPKKLRYCRDMAIEKGLTYAFLLEGVCTDDLFTLANVMKSYSLRILLDRSCKGPDLQKIRDNRNKYK